VVSPRGERVSVPLEQTGPGRYDGKFPTKEVGAYLINLLEKKDGKLAGSQVLGASVNYSPEFLAAEPNFNLLRRISEIGGGRILDIQNPAFNPFEFNRQKTFQPNDLWEWLLRLAILLFPIDVGIRRIQLDRAEWERFLSVVRAKVLFWRGKPRPVEAEESLDALLVRRAEVRAKTTTAEPIPDLFRPANAPKVDEVAPASSSQSGPVEQKPAAKEAQPETGTTSRLLEAKRRAQKRQ
jgi:Ca-activated chloride channel family protein